MKNIAIANGLSLAGYARADLAEGKSALDLVGEYARALPGVDRVCLLSPAGSKAQVPPVFVPVEQEDWSLPQFLRRLGELSSGYDNIFYFHADCPLLDTELSAKMLDSHVRYFADYTFADGYPGGLTPEILKTQLVPPLIALAGESGELPGRRTLFEVIQKDINAFEIETIISPQDLRLLRLDLAADCRSNFLLLERLVKRLQEQPHGGGEAVCRLVQEEPELLRTLPAYFNIQIVEGCPQLCSYCPYPQFGIRTTGKQAEMAAGDFERLAVKIHEFASEAVVSVSLWGEPAYHSRIADLIAVVQSLPGLKPLIETSGIGWKQADLAALARNGGCLPDWIVSLDAHAEESYQKLRGAGRGEALETVQSLLSYFPGHVYVQAVRMKENDEDLERFYQHWKDGPADVIVQKYDHFCGLLPDRRVSDLSPLKRSPCWHLKRDLNVLLDGRVPLCREDTGASLLLGNIFSDGPEAVWSAGEAYYRRHLREEYPELCRKCDEYYTYNF
jgi:spiro-SPASM protein